MRVNKCCLLINDSPFDQAIFVQALNNVAPDTICFTTTNCYDAIHLMTEENVTPSYIFVELNMPGMNGLDFLKTIKKIETLKEIPIVVHSTTPQPHKIIELKESGALAIYLRKYEYTGVCNMLTLYFGSTMVTIKQN
jgi:CheY-like chemotaxis protein